MENLLLKYMNERVRHTAIKTKVPGPVITISRECGCAGRVLAEKLTERINAGIKDPAQKWKWISKEILNLASNELKIHPDKVSDLLKAEEKNFLDAIVSSFADKYYVHDTKIKRVIEEVVRSFAVRGNAVLLGRGSEVLSQDIPRSLHIRFFAPIWWKTAEISQRFKISPEEATKVIAKVDDQRAKFRDAYLAKNQDKALYDIEFNCAKLSHDEIIEIVMKVAEYKSLL